MCGRFVQIDQNIERMKSLLNPLWSLDTYPPHPKGLENYNVTPGSTVVVATKPNANLELSQMKWGLIPSWAKEKRKLIFNARSETIAERPTFKEMAPNRAIIAVEGFYEWKKSTQTDGKQAKQPYFFHRSDGDTMLLAGLYERQVNHDTGEITDDFVILTMGANSFMKPYHDRMPVIIEPDQVEDWLSNAPISSHIKSLTLNPASSIRCYPVSDQVNRVANNHRLLMQPI